MYKDKILKKNIIFDFIDTSSLGQVIIKDQIITKDLVITKPSEEDNFSDVLYNYENDIIHNMVIINDEHLEINDKITYVFTKGNSINIDSKSDTRKDVSNFEYFVGKLTNEFISIVNEDIFEFGYTSNSERFINTHISNNQFDIKSWLEDIFLSYFDNPTIAIGILHIISHFKYEIIKPQGQTIALAALNHKNIEVRECAIRAFENWGHIDSLRILKNIKCDEKWLFEYVEQIISDLESELN